MRLNNEENQEKQPSNYPSIFSTRVQHNKLITLHLDENIQEPSYYRGIVDELMGLTQNDSVQILINSHGGDYYGMLTLIESIRNTEADVLAVITGMAASAASIIALSCPSLMICDGATMMIHSLSYGTFGKESDVRSYTQFMTKQTDKLIRQTYDGFLTKQEIDEVIQGREIWFDAEEIRERAARRTKFLARQSKKKFPKISKIQNVGEETVSPPKGEENTLKIS